MRSCAIKCPPFRGPTRALVFLTVAVLMGPALPAHSARYRYRDDSGQIHVVADEGKIPPEYKSRAIAIETKPHPKRSLTSAEPPNEEMRVPANAVPSEGPSDSNAVGEDRETGIDKGLYGAWYFPKIEKFGMTHLASLVIEQSRITATNRCSYRGRTFVARVASPAQTTANQLTVLEAKYDEKGNFPNCQVSLVRGTVSYRLQNGRLLFIDPDSGETVEFTRRAP